MHKALAEEKVALLLAVEAFYLAPVKYQITALSVGKGGPVELVGIQLLEGAVIDEVGDAIVIELKLSSHKGQ